MKINIEVSLKNKDDADSVIDEILYALDILPDKSSGAYEMEVTTENGDVQTFRSEEY